MIFNQKDQERFWSKVDKREPDVCWPWLDSTKGGTSYGQFRDSYGVMWVAHRVSYLIHNEAIQGEVIRHLCNNKACVNPLHLIAGTHTENKEDLLRSGHVIPGRPKTTRPSIRKELLDKLL